MGERKKRSKNIYKEKRVGLGSEIIKEID